MPAVGNIPLLVNRRAAEVSEEDCTIMELVAVEVASGQKAKVELRDFNLKR
jgi:hypothetical protein